MCAKPQYLIKQAEGLKKRDAVCVQTKEISFTLRKHIIESFHAIVYFILLMGSLYTKMHAHQWLTKRGSLKRRKAKRAKGGKSKKWKTIKTDTGTQDKRWLTSPWKRIFSKTTKTGVFFVMG